MDERRVLGWRVRVSIKGCIFFTGLKRAESLAEATNETLQECYADGTVQTALIASNPALSTPRA